MLRIGQSVFPQPDKFSNPQVQLDYALKEVQDGVSFSEASFFIGAGEIVFNGLTQQQLDILLGLQENFIPVQITHPDMDYEGVAILRLEYEQIREFQDFYETTVFFQEVAETEANARRFYKVAFKTPTRTVIQPIERMDITRKLGGSANCNIVLDSVSGEFDPDNPRSEDWVSTEGQGALELMKYRIAEGGEHYYTGSLSLIQGIIDKINPSGYFGAGKDKVTFRLSDKMNHMPYIKLISDLYTDEESRVILTDVLNEAGIGGEFSGGINVPELQFVDTSYQNAINMLLQAEFAAGCVDGDGNFKIFSLATDQVHYTIPQLLIEDLRPSYGSNRPVTAVRVAISPKKGDYREGEEKIIATLTGDVEGVVKINVKYPFEMVYQDIEDETFEITDTTMGVSAILEPEFAEVKDVIGTIDGDFATTTEGEPEAGEIKIDHEIGLLTFNDDDIGKIAVISYSWGQEDETKGRMIMASPQVEPLEGHTGIVDISVVNRGDNCDILITGLANGGHYNLQLKAKQVIEGDSGFEVIYHDSHLEEVYGGRIEKKISNYAVQEEEAGLDLARNYLTLENWKRVSYSIKLAGFLDLYPGQTVKFKHIKFGHDVQLLLEEVKHSWKAGDTLKTSIKGWKVGDFYV